MVEIPLQYEEIIGLRVTAAKNDPRYARAQAIADRYGNELDALGKSYTGQQWFRALYEKQRNIPKDYVWPSPQVQTTGSFRLGNDASATEAPKAQPRAGDPRKLQVTDIPPNLTAGLYNNPVNDGYTADHTYHIPSDKPVEYFTRTANGLGQRELSLKERLLMGVVSAEQLAKIPSIPSNTPECAAERALTAINSLNSESPKKSDEVVIYPGTAFTLQQKLNSGKHAEAKSFSNEWLGGLGTAWMDSYKVKKETPNIHAILQKEMCEPTLDKEVAAIKDLFSVFGVKAAEDDIRSALPTSVDEKKLGVVKK